MLPPDSSSKTIISKVAQQNSRIEYLWSTLGHVLMLIITIVTSGINSLDWPSWAHMAAPGARGIPSGGRVLEVKTHRCKQGSYLENFPMTCVCLSSSCAGNMCLASLSLQNIIPDEGMSSFLNDH